MSPLWPSVSTVCAASLVAWTEDKLQELVKLILADEEYDDIGHGSDGGLFTIFPYLENHVSIRKVLDREDDDTEGSLVDFIEDDLGEREGKHDSDSEVESEESDPESESEDEEEEEDDDDSKDFEEEKDSEDNEDVEAEFDMDSEDDCVCIEDEDESDDDVRKKKEKKANKENPPKRRKVIVISSDSD